MIGYRDRFVSANGLHFHYLEWQGPPDALPVVLLHGTTGNAHGWDEISEFLAPHFRVYALDCRNHGDSDSTAELTDPLVLADDVRAVTEAIGLQRFGLIGHSMGGRQAMTFAGYHPDRLAWLVIEDIAPTTPAAGSGRVGSFLQSIPESFASADEFIAFMRPMSPRATEAQLRARANFSLGHLPGGRVYLKYVPLTRGSIPTSPLDLWEHVRRITCPTLLIRGAETDILDDDIVERFVRTVPDARAVTIPEAGHSVHADQPLAYQRALAEFLGVPPPA